MASWFPAGEEDLIFKRVSGKIYNRGTSGLDTPEKVWVWEKKARPSPRKNNSFAFSEIALLPRAQTR